MKINGKDYRLPKQFKAKWVKALRSGDYGQTTGLLKKTSLYDKEGVYIKYNKPHYCCLGVACVVAKVPELKIHGGTPCNISKEYNALIPKLLKDGSKECEYICGKLVKLNDVNKWSFKQIAAYINRYL